MSEEQRIAYVRGMLLQAEIEMQGMVAANQECAIRGETPQYKQEDLMELINKQGVYHNSLITNLTGEY